MEIGHVLSNAQKVVHTKQDLFLRLCSLNYLNALVKKEEYKGLLAYGMIKPKVVRLAIDLAKNGKIGLCEELCFKPNEDCLFVKCYGLQFSFHKINIKLLEEECPELRNCEEQWEGIKLQPIAGTLYKLALEAIEKDFEEDAIRGKIKDLIIID